MSWQGKKGRGRDDAEDDEEDELSSAIGSLTIDNGSADMPASPGAGGKLSKKERKRAAAAAANAAAVGDRDEDDDEEKGEEDVEEDESVAGAPGKSAAGSRKGDKKGRRKVRIVRKPLLGIMELHAICALGIVIFIREFFRVASRSDMVVRI